MASADRLESPYVIGGVTIQDGDYITLSISDLNNTGLSSAFGSPSFNNVIYNVSSGTAPQVQIGVSSNANYAGQSAQTRTVSLTQNLDRTLYVSNDVYTLKPAIQQPTITYDNNSTSNATTGYTYTPNPYTQTYTDPPKSNVTSYTSAPGSSDVVMAPTSINFVRAQNWYVSGYPDNGAVPDPSLTLASGNTNALPMLTNGSSTVGKTTTQPPLLCVELHDDDYMALRTPSGKYLHLLPAGQADSSTSPGPMNLVPQGLVLSFSSLPSSQYTAQWSVYLMNGSTSQVVLQNRATDTCLTLDNSNRQVAADYIFYQLNPNVGQQFIFDYIYSNNVQGPARLYYNAYTSMFAQWWDTYTQQYYRLTGTSTIDQVGTNAIFTITKLTLPCSIGLNPLSPTCINSTSTLKDGQAAAAILNICASGDMFRTPACQTWALTNPDQAAEAVLTYLQNNPNDTTFGGCQNIWAFRELIDYLSLTTPPTTLYAECNLKQCQPASAWKSTAQKNRTCVQQICAQGVNFNGTVSDSTISNVTQNCTFNNGTATSSDPSSGGSQMTSPFQPLLDGLEYVYDETMTKIGWTQFVIALLISTVVLCVILLALPMLTIDTAITLSLATGLVSLFLI